MHPEAFAWVHTQVAEAGPWDGARVLDIGGRDVNGTARTHLDRYPDVLCHVLDIRDSAEVDYVADARTWDSPRPHHLVLCTEVLEHVQGWPAICWTAHEALLPGGLLVLTCAGPGRGPHNATDGGPLAGEWYQNVHPEVLAAVLDACGFCDISVDDSVPGDVYAAARRP